MPAGRRPATLAVLTVVCAVAASGASAEFGHRLKPGPLAFMRTVTLPKTPVPKAVRAAFAEHRFLELRAGRSAFPPHMGRSRSGSPPIAAAAGAPGSPSAGRAVLGHMQLVEAGVRSFRPNVPWPDVVSRPRRSHRRASFGARVSRPEQALRSDQRLVRTPPSALVVVRGHREIAKERFPDVYRMQQLLTPGRRPAGTIKTRARRVLVRPTPQGPAATFVAPSKFRRAHCWWLHVGRGSYGGGCVRDAKSTSSIWSVAPLGSAFAATRSTCCGVVSEASTRAWGSAYPSGRSSCSPSPGRGNA